jgi:hypothetical protein
LVCRSVHSAFRRVSALELSSLIRRRHPPRSLTITQNVDPFSFVRRRFQTRILVKCITRRAASRIQITYVYSQKSDEMTAATMQLELVESISGVESIPAAGLKLGSGGRMHVPPSAPSHSLEPIDMIDTHDLSFIPFVDSHGVYGLDRMTQIRVWEDAKKSRERFNAAWNDVIEVDAIHAIRPVAIHSVDEHCRLEANVKHEHRHVSFQQLLEENAGLIMKLHNIQETRLAKGAIKPDAHEVALGTLFVFIRFD